MYLQTGFGQLAAPLPKDSVSHVSITRIIVVPFRKNFTAFRAEVRKALGRYTSFRSDQGAFLDRLLLDSVPSFLEYIQKRHNYHNSISPLEEFSPVSLMVTFVYTPGFKKVTAIRFP
jgi:hypothetical protein